MMTLSDYHAALRAAAALAATLAALDAGTTGATIDLYASVRPANGAAPGGSALATFTLAQPAGTITAGVLTLTLPDDALILTTGIAAWARFTADGHILQDCDVTDTLGTGTVRLATTQLYAGGSVHMASGTLS